MLEFKMKYLGIILLKLIKNKDITQTKNQVNVWKL